MNNRWLIFSLLIGFLGGSCQKLPQYLSICEVQGEELQSPFLDREVILSGLVSGIQEGIEPRGLMIVDEGCSLEAEGSRGIFVQADDAPGLVEVGDKIRVRGWVREVGNETRLEADSGALEILSLDNNLPEPVDLEQILVPPLRFGYEEWEGQLVLIPQAELLGNMEVSARPQVLPNLTPGPTDQLICFQANSFPLGISWDPNDMDSDWLQPGSLLTGLVGWIRQDQDGYFLQLKDEPQIPPGDGDQLAGGSDPGQTLLAAETASSDSPAAPPSLTPEPTGTPSLTFTPQPSSSPTLIPTPTYYQVRLLISEIYPNPTGDEPGGEWIELYNPGRGWLLLDGIKIGDETSPTGSEGLLRFPDGYYLGGGKTLLIANQALIFESFYGFLPDFELENSHPLVPDLHRYYLWGKSAIKLSNSGDEVLLLDPWDQVVDLVVYGNSDTGYFSPPLDPPREGHSLERYPPGLDLGLASDWREQADPSPGELDLTRPTPAATSTAPVTPSPTISGSPTFPSVTDSLTPSLPPSATLDAPATTQPGIPGQNPTPSFSITPTPSPGSSTPLPPTASPPGTAQPTSSSTAVPSGEATPTSKPSETISIGSPLLINEILADPDPLLGDSNGDGQISSDDDEFLELVNISGASLDISGWQIFDSVRLRYTFPEGSIISPSCGLVVFGGGSPSGGFGGSRVFSAGSLGLNNSGDLVSVRDRNGQEVAWISYGSEGNQDQSLTRNPDLSNQLPLALHGQVSGALFSPGTRVDGSVFGACP